VRLIEQFFSLKACNLAKGIVTEGNPATGIGGRNNLIFIG
jgi:hypothetical protein